MKKDKSTIFLGLVFLLGLGILLYPTISNYYNKVVGSYLISNYENKVSNSSNEDINSILNKAKEYNTQLLQKPTSLKNGESKDNNYLSQLKLDEDFEPIGTIKIDKIDVNLPIYHGTSEPILQRGIGHLEGSSLPIGGESTHAILTGHTGLPSAKLLTDLNKLEIGDIIVIKVLNETLTYQVDNSEVVEPHEIQTLGIEEGKDKLTLVTCTPYGINSHRLLVHSNRIDNIETQDTGMLDSKIKNIDYTLLASLIALFIVFVFFISFIIYKRVKNK